MASLPPLPDIAPRPELGADRPQLGADRPQLASKAVPATTTPPAAPQQPKTLMQFLADAREALVGIPADFLAKRGTVYDIVTKNNRLRGVGVMLIVISLVLVLADILGSS